MGESVTIAATMKIFFGIFSIFLLINYSYTHPRQRKQLSLFSVVQFPNDECVSTTSSITTMGTCLTASERTNRAGASSGTCAAGFGVCCVVLTSKPCLDTRPPLLEPAQLVSKPLARLGKILQLSVEQTLTITCTSSSEQRGLIPSL